MKLKTGVKAGEDLSTSPSLDLPIDAGPEAVSSPSPGTPESTQSDQPSVSD